MATQGKQEHMRIVNGVIYYQDKDSLRKRKELATELLNTIQICEGGKLIFGKNADALIKKLNEHPQSAISNATAKLRQAKWDVAEAAKVHENDGLALTEKMDEDDVTCISSFNSQAFGPLDNGRLSDDDSSRSYVDNGTTQSEASKPKVLKDCVSSSVSIMEYEETPVKVQNKRNKTTKTKGGKEKTTSFKNGSGQQEEKMLWCKQKGCETYHRGIKRLRKHVTKKHPKVDASRITEYNYVSYVNEIGLIGGLHEVPLSSSSIRRPRAKPENKKSKGQKQRAASPVKCAEKERFFWCKQKGCNKYIQGITRLRNHVTKRHPKVDASRITQWNYATFDSLLAQSVPTVPTTDK